MAESPVKELRFVLVADDYDTAVAFWRDTLGLPVVMQWDEDHGSGAVLDAGRATVEVLSRREAEFVDQVEVGRAAAGPRVAMEVDDSATMAERFVSAGAAERLGAPVETPWGDRNVRLRTPGGLQLTLFTVR
ncbi:MAG: VOC family protein [Acidimicrobiales bacterium]